jgi:hypothetical protein
MLSSYIVGEISDSNFSPFSTTRLLTLRPVPNSMLNIVWLNRVIRKLPKLMV